MLWLVWGVFMMPVSTSYQIIAGVLVLVVGGGSVWTRWIMTERRADCCCYCYEVGEAWPGLDIWPCATLHNPATMLQEAHSLTQESQRQRDHYHDDELTNLSDPVSTSSSSHDSPPDDAVYGLCFKNYDLRG